VIFPYDAFLRLVASGAAAQRRCAPRGLLNVGNSCYANATMQARGPGCELRAA
jgi:ubiquitin C-terminal hydrolase